MSEHHEMHDGRHDRQRGTRWGKGRPWRYHPYEIVLPSQAAGDAEELFDRLSARLDERDVTAGYAELGDETTLGERIDLCQELLESDLLFVAGQDSSRTGNEAERSAGSALLGTDDLDTMLARIDSLVEDVTPCVRGLVLAGGSSRRMGADKAMISYHGVPQLEHVVRLLAPLTESVHISVRDESDAPPAARALADAGAARLLPDRFMGLGPISGIMSALSTEPDSAWLVVAVDLPFLEQDDLKHLLANRNPLRFATAFGTPEPEPVCTIYEPKSLPRMLGFMAQGVTCPRRFLKGSRSVIVPPPREETMINANSPDERDAALATLVAQIDSASAAENEPEHGAGPAVPDARPNHTAARRRRNDSSLITPAQVDSLLAALDAGCLRTQPTVIGIGDARGRTLAQPVVADRDQPPFERATMDGIAVRHDEVKAGVTRFSITGTLAAGEDPASFAAEGESTCVEIMTGAPVPPGYDRVVRYEDLAIDAERAVAELNIATDSPWPAIRWSNVHRAGSDFRKGDTLATEGTFVTSPIVSVLASCGQSKLSVRTMPRVALVSTGTEVVAIETQPAPFQIRGSNAATLVAELRSWGVSEIEQAHFTDDPTVIESGLRELLDRTDLLIMCGGVSRGRFDFVPDVLERLGVETLAHGVAQRPGKPFLIGRREENLVFGLPGNPVSSLVCLRRYVIPLLVGKRAAPAHIALDRSLDWNSDLTCFPAVTLADNRNGQISARPIVGNGSGDFYSLAPSHGFVEVTSHTSGAGDVVPFYRWGDYPGVTGGAG